MSFDAVLSSHNHRLERLDPMLPVVTNLPPPQDHDVPLKNAGAFGVARLVHVDPDDFVATWSAVEVHRLFAVVSDVPSTADLCEQWNDVVIRAATPGSTDSECVLTWPSRDTAVTPYLRRYAMVQRTVLAVRLAGRDETVERDSGVVVRALSARDLDAATRLWLEEVTWGRQFHGTPERSATEHNVRWQLERATAVGEPWGWVAEVGGDVVGLAVVSSPARMSWAAWTVAAEPVAYVDSVVVDDAYRGRGVGTALMRQVHAAMAERGIAASLLHYATMNPLAGPFWHRWGYRPLWTVWSRRPAIADKGHRRGIRSLIRRAVRPGPPSGPPLRR